MNNESANKIVSFLSEEHPGVPGVITESCRRACEGVDLDEEHFNHIKRQLRTNEIKAEINGSRS